jgi:predicted aminopeptidase
LLRLSLDAAVVPASAYNTPLPFADPLPSAVLAYGVGDLAELLIHEFAHGTLGGEESAAQWIGAHGAELYLTERFGDSAPEFLDWRESQERSETRSTLFDALAKKLEACYAVTCGDREALFAASGLQARSTTPSSPRSRTSASPASNLVGLADILRSGSEAHLLGASGRRH